MLQTYVSSFVLLASESSFVQEMFQISFGRKPNHIRYSIRNFYFILAVRISVLKNQIAFGWERNPHMLSSIVDQPYPFQVFLLPSTTGLCPRLPSHFNPYSFLITSCLFISVFFQFRCHPSVQARQKISTAWPLRWSSQASRETSYLYCSDWCL